MDRIELAVRIDEKNPNHHLWNNNGTWWIHYTIYPNHYQAERIRRSLRTKSVEEARRLRDELLLEIECGEVCGFEGLGEGERAVA